MIYMARSALGRWRLVLFRWNVGGLRITASGPSIAMVDTD